MMEVEAETSEGQKEKEDVMEPLELPPCHQLDQ